MAALDAELDARLRDYVSAVLADALITAGRRPLLAERTANILTPAVMDLLDEPLVRAHLKRRPERLASPPTTQ